MNPTELPNTKPNCALTCSGAHRRLQNDNSRKEKGFAVIIAISLMAFILLLLIGFVSFVQIEIRSAKQQMDLLQSRSNARLAAMIALGNLQKSAGIDRVAISSADIFIPDRSNPLGIVSPSWVGVWETSDVWDANLGNSFYENQALWDGLSQEVKLQRASRWLVSNSDPNDLPLPTDSVINGSSTDDYLLVARVSDNTPLPDGTARDGIYAPSIELSADTGQTIGAFAWWVADESAKAKVNIPDDYFSLGANQGESIRASLAIRPSPERVAGNLSAYEPDLFENVIDLGLWGEVVNESDPALPRELFPDFTTHGYGLFTNTREGGLKKDLSVAFDVENAFDRFQDGLSTFNFTKLDPYFHAPTTEAANRNDSRNGAGGTFLDNYVFALEDVVFDQHPDGGGSGTDPVVGAPWNLLAYHHNLHQLTNGGDSISAQRAFNETYDTNPIFRRNGTNLHSNLINNVRSYNYHAAQSLHSQVRSGSGGVDSNNYLKPTDEAVTYPIAPLITELRLSVEVEYTSAGEVVLHYTPLLEMTNPYDVSIQFDTDTFRLYFTVERIAALLDFRLSSPAGLPQNRWSALEQTIDGSSLPDIGNLPTTILSGGYRPNAGHVGDPNSLPDGGAQYPSTSSFTAGLNARLSSSIYYANNNQFVNGTVYRRINSASPEGRNNFYIPADNLPVFAPGEVKTFSLDPGNPNQWAFFLAESSGPPASQDKQLRSYTMRDKPNSSTQFIAQYMDHDSTIPGWGATGDNGLWPSHPSLYDTLEVEVLFAPAYQKVVQNGNKPKNRNDAIINTWLTSDNGSGELRYTINTYDLETHSYTDSQRDPLDFQPKTLTLGRGEREWIYTYRISHVSEDEMALDFDAIDFLGGTNPRASAFYGNTGFDGGQDTLPMLRVEIDVLPTSAPNDATFGSWGDRGSGSNIAPLFHVPRRAPVSIADYRHANLAWESHTPAMPIGNSLMPTFQWIDPTKTWRAYGSSNGQVGDTNLAVSFGNDSYNASWGSTVTNVIVDQSYHLNASLFDGYFLSTLSDDNRDGFISGLTQEQRLLPNGRIRQVPGQSGWNNADYANFRRSAGGLAIDGAFNVNSTSVKAWASLLRSMQDIQPELFTGVTSDIFIRHPRVPSSDLPWSGASPLDEENLFTEDDTAYEIAPDSLAGHIVQEIKERGPFLSLSHFINRQLVNDTRGEAGALHAAIQDSSINGSNNPFAIGSLSQADLIGALGDSLQSRSDSFLIRTVGRSLDPVDGSTSSETWCEVVVQRVPEYVDNLQPAYERLEDLNEVNATFGRRFRIISFRYLTQDEI